MTKVCMLGPHFHLNYNIGKFGKKKTETVRYREKGRKEKRRKEGVVRRKRGKMLIPHKYKVSMG